MFLYTTVCHLLIECGLFHYYQIVSHRLKFLYFYIRFIKYDCSNAQMGCKTLLCLWYNHLFFLWTTNNSKYLLQNICVIWKYVFVCLLFLEDFIIIPNWINLLKEIAVGDSFIFVKYYKYILWWHNISQKCLKRRTNATFGCSSDLFRF